MAMNIDLLTWCRENEPNDDMIYKNSFWNQILFVRDTLNAMLHDTYEEYRDNPVLVINTHKSKSIDLPVYEINLRDYDTKIIMRNNFYDWKVSVESLIEINADFMGLFKQNETITPVYCEGFKDNQVFSCYKDNKKRFTIEIGDKYKLYTFMFILKNYLKGAVKNAD